MKGPHFFEKRKKEQARQEKLKQKADRKAQRKLEKDRGDGTPGEAGDDDLDDIEGLEPALGMEGAQPESNTPGQDGEAAPTAEPESRQPPSAGDVARGS